MREAKRQRIGSIAAAFACAAALFAGLALQSAAAQTNKKAYVTVSSPLQIPGTVLSPGTYIFRVLDSTSNRQLIQVWSEDLSKLYVTVLGVPDYRLTSKDKPILTFDSQTPQIASVGKAWCSPADSFCLVFVYPHNHAAELAREYREPVLSMPEALAANLGTGEIRANSPSVEELQQANVSAVGMKGETIRLTDVILDRPKG
jgi:hypothetical protein